MPNASAATAPRVTSAPGGAPSRLTSSDASSGAAAGDSASRRAPWRASPTGAAGGAGVRGARSAGASCRSMLPTSQSGNFAVTIPASASTENGITQ